jgi:peptidoglycan/LPS O-acetylase OafA/YrhL
MDERRTKAFPLVHSMRALAALSVLLYHAAFKSYLADHPRSLLTPYAAHLDVGVPVFFLISGFVLYRPMVAARLRCGPPLDTNAYAWRRILRIVPGYWVALVVAGVAGASYFGYPEIFSARGAVGYFGFLQIYSPDTAGGGINVAWTLCVEVTFYAFLPLWAGALRRVSPRGGVRSELVALGGLFAASVAWQVAAVHATNPNGFGLGGARWLEPLPGFLDQFAIGMALAVLSVAWEGRRAARSWAGWVLAALAFWVVSTRLGLHGARDEALTPGVYLARHQLYTVIALGLLLPAVFASGRRHRLLDTRALAALGTISYGIYLYHVPVLRVIGLSGGPPGTPAELVLWLAAAISITLLLAWASWRLVERPALRLAPPRRARPVPEPAADPAA